MIQLNIQPSELLGFTHWLTLTTFQRLGLDALLLKIELLLDISVKLEHTNAVPACVDNDIILMLKSKVIWGVLHLVGEIQAAQ